MLRKERRGRPSDWSQPEDLNDRLSGRGGGYLNHRAELLGPVLVGLPAQARELRGAVPGAGRRLRGGAVGACVPPAGAGVRLATAAAAIRMSGWRQAVRGPRCRCSRGECTWLQEG